MFQACVSISACIFYVFMNIYTGYVCINGHTAGSKKKKIPYFSVARYANTIFFFLPNAGTLASQIENNNIELSTGLSTFTFGAGSHCQVDFPLIAVVLMNIIQFPN